MLLERDSPREDELFEPTGEELLYLICADELPESPTSRLKKEVVVRELKARKRQTPPVPAQPPVVFWDGNGQKTNPRTIF